MDDVESSEEEEEEDEKVGELFWKGLVNTGAEPPQNTLWPMRGGTERLLASLTFPLIFM